MFTGIIETTGTIERLDVARGKMTVATPLSRELSPGDSIAVNGACLTVTTRRAASFDMDVSPETFRRTSFGKLRKGSRVNLERALAADGRLAGHFLLGHVDGTGALASRKDHGEFATYRFRYPASLSRYLIPKGSIGVHGVSLTIADLGPRTFDVALIPVTLELTNLADLEVGDPVNLEADMIGKYVMRFLDLSGAGGSASPPTRRRRGREL